MTTLENVRQEFPGLSDKIFLDAACISLAPRRATEAIRRFLDMALTCPSASATLHHIAMDEMRAAARAAVARLINAGEDEIALVESTTHGLAAAAQAIPLAPGDRVLMPDLEFMEVAIPWCQKGQREGIEIDVVPNREGRVEIETIAKHLHPRTRVIAVSSVQWSNGFRCDLKALSRFCRERNLWLVVDAIQQLGAMPMNVRDTPVDFLVCGGHKWLNAPFGCGFLYIDRDVLPRLDKPLAGYLSVEPPEGGWGAYFQTPSIRPDSDYRYTSEARLYEIGGTGNYPGAIGLAASLELIFELKPLRIEQKILQLTDHLISGLSSLGVKLVTPPEREHRSGIVTFTTGSASSDTALMQRLLVNKVLVSVRYTSNVGGVRVSSHFFNSLEEINRLLNLVESYARQEVAR